ncbi:MAG: histidine phosphotransferase family protein [Pseudomonadota bacterium]
MTSPASQTPSAQADETLALLGLLGSRICHDLISPLGAIGNGIELLAMSGSSAGPETALIEDSVRNANARIRFFRIAFGAAQPGQSLSRREVLSVIDDISHGARVSFDWTVEGDVSRCDARLAFLLMQCFETVMPFGGTVRIINHPSGWGVIGTSDRFRDEPGLWALAEGKHHDISDLKAADLHFALTPLVAQDMNRAIEITHSPTEISVRF